MWVKGPVCPESDGETAAAWRLRATVAPGGWPGVTGVFQHLGEAPHLDRRRDGRLGPFLKRACSQPGNGQMLDEAPQGPRNSGPAGLPRGRLLLTPCGESGVGRGAPGRLLPSQPWTPVTLARLHPYAS